MHQPYPLGAGDARAERRGISLTHSDANILRRAERTLHRWSELECGDGNDHASWAIERDETTGKPYMGYHPHQGKPTRTPIADREAGALRRVAALCKERGLHFYHQTDPRGAALYIDREPLPDNNYSRGLCCAID